MQFLKDHRYVLFTILIVTAAILLKAPLFFSLILIPVLLSLRADLRRYYVTSVFIFLAFYGSYALFNIEPLYAPKLIKIGKDLLWAALLVFSMPFLNWEKIFSFPKPILYLAALFTIYILIHASIANPSWSGRLLEIRDYLEYLPLAFIPALILKTQRPVDAIVEDFLLIAAFVALFALVQDKIPGISVLGQYRVNSTLPNFFHMAMLLNAAALLIVATIVRYKDHLNKKLFTALLVLLGLFSYCSLLSDSRGLDSALFGSLVIAVALLIPVWKKSWMLLIPPAVAALAFFTVGPSWAANRFFNLREQFTHTFVTQNNQQSKSTGVLNAVQENLNLVNKETKDKNQRDFTVSHSSDSSVASRAFNISNGFNEIKGSPLVGHGMLLKNGDPSTAYATDFFAMDSIVHLGIIGAALFFGLVGSLLLWFTRFYLKHHSKSTIVILVAFIGIITQYLVSALTTSSWIAFPVNALFWLYVGLGSALIIHKPK